MLTHHPTACQSAHHPCSPPENGHTRMLPDTATELRVWINTRSGIYHHPARRWHGITVEGQFTSEGVARNEGYRAARNGQ